MLASKKKTIVMTIPVQILPIAIQIKTLLATQKKTNMTTFIMRTRTITKRLKIKKKKKGSLKLKKYRMEKT